jgi:hypothetical protein
MPARRVAADRATLAGQVLSELSDREREKLAVRTMARKWADATVAEREVILNNTIVRTL